jgi:AcrR family transcriptional regulator
MTETIRAPQQDRSRLSLEKVLAAGVELLTEKGFDGFSIADVSARSGVSVGSIYQRFPNKAVLFTALQERILAEIDREQDRLFDAIGGEGTDAAARLDAAIHAVARHFRRHEPLFRAMILRGAVDEATRARGSRSSLVLARSFAGFVRTRISPIAHEDPEVATDVCFRIVYAALTRRIMSGPTFESTLELPWDRFVDELARACRAYLLGPGPVAS